MSTALMFNPLKRNTLHLSKAIFVFFGLHVILIKPIYAQALLEVENLGQARITVIYQLNFREDSNDLNRVRNERVMLLIGDGISMFASYNKLRNDSLLRVLNERDGVTQVLGAATAGRAPTRFGGLHILKNFNNNRLIYKDQVFMDWFIYEEPLNIINWALTDQKGAHIGYKVQKATARFGGRKWEAWFAPDIPISDGPYKFNGLPGLILKIQDTENHYVFTAELMYVPAKERQIYRPNRRAYHLRRYQFLETRKNEVQLRSQQLAEWGNCPAMIQQLEQRGRRRNNPIQLRAE